MENQETNSVEIKPDSDTGLIRQWIKDEILLLTEPSRFFSERFKTMGFTQSLAFGLVFSWIAAFLEWMTRSVKKESLFAGFNKLKDKMQALPIWKDLPDDIWAQGDQLQSIFPEWGFEGLKMLVNPFHQLILYFLYGSTLWIGTKILVMRDSSDSDPINLKTMIQLSAVASASTVVGSILGFFPFGIGSFLGWVFQTFILVIGVEKVVKISKLRSLAVIFMPSIIMFILAACLIALLVIILMALFASLFQ